MSTVNSRGLSLPEVTAIHNVEGQEGGLKERIQSADRGGGWGGRDFFSFPRGIVASLKVDEIQMTCVNMLF